MEELLLELRETAQKLEDSIPANPASKRNEKAQSELESAIKKYFNLVKSSVDRDALDSLYYKHVVQEAASKPLWDGIHSTLNPWLNAFQGTLRQTIMSNLVQSYLLGSAQMITWGQTKAGIPIAFEGPPITQATRYAEIHCAKLVTQITDETRNRLAQCVADAIEGKQGVEGLARSLYNEFDDMSRYRSELIARTETCDALEQAFIDRATDMGVTGKAWITTDPCPVCQANEDAGDIPINDVFPSGDMRPPAHPSCRCALAPVMLPEEKP